MKKYILYLKTSVSNKYYINNYCNKNIYLLYELTNYKTIK